MANHFVEYAGFDCDWSLLPAVEQRRAFFASYLQAGGGSDLQHVEAKKEASNEAAVEAAEGEIAAKVEEMKEEEPEVDAGEEGVREREARREQEAGNREAMLLRLEREVDAFEPVSHLWQARPTHTHSLTHSSIPLSA